MDPADAQTEPAHQRASQRERYPPAYLSEYVVATLPSEGQTHTTHSAPSIQSSHSQKTGMSRRSSNSRSKCSSRSSRSTTSRFSSHVLSELDTAQLEERVKEMELEELQQTIEEDQQADNECQRLQTQAREAQQLQEEAIRAQELLARQMEKRRQLKKKCNELEIAKMVTSLLKVRSQDSGDTGSSPHPSDQHKISNPILPPTPAPLPMAIAPHAAKQHPALPPTAAAPRSVSIAPPQVLHATLPTTAPALSTVIVSTPPMLHRAQPIVAPTPPMSVATPLTVPAPHPAALPPVSAAQPLTVPALHPAAPPPVSMAPPSSMLPGLAAVDYNLVSAPYSVYPVQYQPTQSASTYPVQTASYPSALPQSSPQQTQVADVPQLFSPPYGIPKPMIPFFESGKESDFALLKIALDNLLNSHVHLNEQYKYQVLLGHLKLQSALQLAKAFMYDPTSHSKEEAKDLVDGLSQLLITGGFEMRQWASNIPEFSTWKDLMQTTTRSLHGAAEPNSVPPSKAADYIKAENLLLRRAQWESFPEEVKALMSDRPLPASSRLGSLSPEYDKETGLVRVGGRLRRAEQLPQDTIHPVLLDPKHPLTNLIIQDFDETLLHPGSERVLVKIGRRTEKRWGIIFKCMTTRCVHLDLLESLDTNTFLMSLRRFISRRGKPFELLSDNGTNFTGGYRELREAFEAMGPQLKEQLAEQQIEFCFNPPSAPHFGGTWEREVRSVKTALKVVLKEQTVPEAVLRTVLVEVEGILNAKPLGYVSSDVADPDPITPSILLMGRYDASLPQAVYDPSNTLENRRWRHSQVLVDHFWSRFIRHYLPSLQER
ncbi:uncharacterized protein LOC118562391 [Fundulus heteroclitus]|uniref:uncharacterized protein LOC118562391 n=1 Tax=Fundulus heteroclitus TaxID=8078 RepID=UPI00165A6236|nr:uncharacterized protein LOC118562391 [Fundulus heteroclitus]